LGEGIFNSRLPIIEMHIADPDSSDNIDQFLVLFGQDHLLQVGHSLIIKIEGELRESFDRALADVDADHIA